jgi:hypothetical protein
MRISEHTDIVLSELAPYIDEALAIMFEEIDNTSYSFKEATERKKKGMSALTKGLIGTGAAAAGGTALLGGTRTGRRLLGTLGGATGKKLAGYGARASRWIGRTARKVSSGVREYGKSEGHGLRGTYAGGKTKGGWIQRQAATVGKYMGPGGVKRVTRGVEEAKAKKNAAKTAERAAGSGIIIARS